MITVNVYVNEPSRRTEVYAFDIFAHCCPEFRRMVHVFEFLTISDLSAAIVQLAGCLNLRDTDVSIIAERIL